MAFRSPRRRRALMATVGLVATTLTVPTLASATPANKPTVASVQRQLSDLAKQNAQLVEQFDQARIAVARQQQVAVAARTASIKASAHYVIARRDFVQIIQAQYEGQGLGAAGALLDSNSDSNYLDRLDTMQLMSSHAAEVVGIVHRARRGATAAAARAKAALATVTAQRDALARKRATVTTQIKTYRTLLAKLTAAQRAAYLRRHLAALNRAAAAAAARAATSAATRKVAARAAATTGTATRNVVPQAAHSTARQGVSTPAIGAGSGAARRAVQFALQQVGKPYVFGAAGPGTYDCSGLTMAAWRAGGVSLPHSAADQYNYGQHVSASQLQPGDLIFMYHPIGHVTIYIGNGLMVSAPEPGEDVSVVRLSSFMSDFVGATRLS